MAGADLASWFVAKAVQAYGDRVLADADGLHAGGPQAAGRELARLIFGSAETGTEIPVPLEEVVLHPDSKQGRYALEVHIDGLLQADIGLASAVAAMLGGSYRQQLDSGDGQALAALGDGLWDHRDYQAARATWERCIATGDPDSAPRAMARLASMVERQLSDDDGARLMFQATFDTGHPEHAPRAMLRLGLLLERTGDDDGARAAYQQAADAAPPGSRGNALCQLANLLKKRGDIAAAKDVWQQVIDTETDEGTPEMALLNLANQLGEEGDLDGLRAACDAATASGVPRAQYALVLTGNVLRDRGDLDGWRDAWLQAINAGYEDADDLLEELSPPAEDEEDDEPADVPPEFDRRNMARTGIAVLESGLPPLLHS